MDRLPSEPPASPAFSKLPPPPLVGDPAGRAPEPASERLQRLLQRGPAAAAAAAAAARRPVRQPYPGKGKVSEGGGGACSPSVFRS